MYNLNGSRGDIITRKQKQKQYEERYKNIPIDQRERLAYLCDHYHITEKQYDKIIERKRNMEYYLQYKDILVVLYEDPEGAKRPRFRIVNRSNYMYEAMTNSQFVHVYSPNASEDARYMKRIVDQKELFELHDYVQTQCIVEFNAYFKTPEYYNSSTKIMSEIGLQRTLSKPDYDNIAKKYSDMFNHNLWIDDSFVVTGIVNKFYSALPRVEVKIRYLNYATDITQYRMITNRKDYNEDYPISYLDFMGRPI